MHDPLRQARLEASSRMEKITVIGVPFGAGAGIRGAELGPAAMRLAGLLPTLEGLGLPIEDRGDLVTGFDSSASKPVLAGQRLQGEGLPGNNAASVSHCIGAAYDAVLTAFRSRALPFVIGGDHSISMGSASAAAHHAAARGRRLKLLWLDAHADFNTPDTSPSGNLHGMSVAFLTGHKSLRQLLDNRPFPAISPADVTIFGARSVDRDEKAAIARAGITSLDMRAIDEFGVCALLRDFLSGIDPQTTDLHISFDLDAIEPSIAPGVGTPVEGGLTYREAHLIMEMLHESGVVTSAEFVELNPMRDLAGQTARLAVDLAGSLFGRTISLNAALLARSQTG